MVSRFSRACGSHIIAASFNQYQSAMIEPRAYQCVVFRRTNTARSDRLQRPSPRESLAALHRSRTDGGDETWAHGLQCNSLPTADPYQGQFQVEFALRPLRALDLQSLSLLKARMTT